MRFPLVVALFAFLVSAAFAAIKFGEAAAVGRTPVTGTWAATFDLDSLHPPSPENWGIRAVAAQTSGVLELVPGIPDSFYYGEPPFWMAGFHGTHSVDFVPILGRDGSQAPQAVGARFDVDSVFIGLSGVCCHTGGVRARGRILGDSITGVWETDSDGWVGWGHFILHRSRPDSLPGGPARR